MSSYIKSKVVALTGSRNSGKKYICEKIHSLFDIPYYDADLSFKFLINYDPILKERIIKEFGEVSFISNFLNTNFFEDNNHLYRLLLLAKDRVMENFLEWRGKQKSPYVILKFSLLYEIPKILNGHYNYSIAVSAPVDERKKRIKSTLGSNYTYLTDYEYDDLKKRDHSDYKIFNYGGNRLQRQLRVIHQNIISSIKETNKIFNTIEK